MAGRLPRSHVKRPAARVFTVAGQDTDRALIGCRSSKQANDSDQCPTLVVGGARRRAATRRNFAITTGKLKTAGS